jgi:hypothetical protein
MGNRVISSPLKKIFPESGKNLPVRRLMKLVFPAPLGPIIEVKTPSSNFKSMPSTA